MKLDKKMALGLAAFVCAAPAQAIVNDGSNPYYPIVERNIFALKEPPKIEEQGPPKPPPANIELKGVMDVLGRKLAMVEWIEPAVPGQPANSKKNYSTFTEGQREGQIEVLEINIKAGTVKVSNYGVTNTLTFKEAPTSKQPGTPFALPSVGGIPAPAANIPAPPPQTAASYSSTTTIGTTPAAAPAVKQIPSRQLRLPPAAQPQAQATTPATAQQQQPVQQLSKEEQEILLEVEREVNKDNPAHPPPPPTSLNPTANLAPPDVPTTPTKPK